MYILGISCYYHDSAACLIKDGKIIAAAQEERFNRDKYSPVFPIQSINYCLQEAGITSLDLDHIAFYEKMYLKFERTILSHLNGFPFTYKNFLETMPLWLKDRLSIPLYIREELSYKKEIYFVKHHLAHAASSYFLSGYDSAAILTVDGVGEYASATFGKANNNQIEIQKEISYPHSLGLLYSIVTAYLGFKVFAGEGKVMALAEFGKPTYLDQFKKLMLVKDDGSFFLDTSYFSFNKGDKMHNKKFIELLGPERTEDSEITNRHKDIAASLQKFTEETILKMVNHLYKTNPSENLCLAGGLFLNVTTNSRILKESNFKNIFIQPAPGDAGSAIGAALYCYRTLLDGKNKTELKSASLGPHFTESQIEIQLRNSKLKYTKHSEDEIAEIGAQFLSEEKVIAWFQGKMEFGPRALGNRSLLADPRSKKMKDWINQTVKHRESFRPFGASVLREKVNQCFDFDHDSPFMLYVADIKNEYLESLPAIKHVNNTSRIQTVTAEENSIYYKLINKFYQKTNIPLILNTSLNDSEPIVNTPKEALQLFKSNQIDLLIIGPFIVKKD